MNDRLAHRGPDGEGFLFAWVEDGDFRQKFLPHTREWDRRHSVRVCLGHRRLAILDLSQRGLQPMAAPDGRVWIAFNGEIYNFQILRAELEAQGHCFRTHTDTEVLLHAYLQWGEDCLRRLQGMYAFAIWDGNRERLFCARDRLGIKPFYYTQTEEFLLFASEIKALMCFQELGATPNDDAVRDFLVHGNCDYGERTMVQGIKALPAAHALSVVAPIWQSSIRRYWHLEPQPLNGKRDVDWVQYLGELLQDTTRQHLVSDVRAGSCLSGGLDSSTVVGVIGKIGREQPEAATAVGDRLYTFTSCWNYPDLDERGYALAMARAVEANPHLVFPTAEDFWSSFPRLAWHQDMPFGSLSFYAQWRVMRAAREAGVKVLLDGQGGDEVFGGYAKFRYAYWASLLRSGQLLRVIREVAATFRQGDRYVLNLRNGYRYLPKRVRKLLKVDSLLKETLRANWDDVVSTESSPATRWWRNACRLRRGNSSWTTMQQIQVDDLFLDTLQGLLRMEDRSSMAFSIEARVPLLDHKLVEYGVSLPDHLKVQDGWSKFAMRQAMRGVLPESVRLRTTKLGFASPDRLWLAHDLRHCVSEFIGEGMRCERYVDPGALRRWYNSPKAAVANTESYLGLFRILSLEMWMRVFKIS
jgi:asparagine synthase (glutamine-hydrolysing)